MNPQLTPDGKFYMIQKKVNRGCDGCDVLGSVNPCIYECVSNTQFVKGIEKMYFILKDVKKVDVITL